MACYRHFILTMGSSPSFGSTPRDVGFPKGETRALFGLAFAAAVRVSRFTAPRSVTRWVILQEARPETVLKTCVSNHRPRTARRHTVSGTISLPSSGCFSPFPHGTRSLSVAKSI